MEIVAFTKHNPKYKEFNHPEEDSFTYIGDGGKIIVAVADGITRDPIGVKNLPDFEKEREAAIEVMRSYPKPSPAKMAADLFCETFVELATERIGLSESAIIMECNRRIRELNKKRESDYLENDYAACVASCGVIDEGVLHYGFITDCGVAVFSSDGRLKFRTKNEMDSNGIRKEIEREPNKYGKNWGDPRFRHRIRSHYRNNPDSPVSYGAFTGEESVAYFIRAGKVKLERGDYVFFYTDGFEPIIFSKGFNPAKIINFESYFENNASQIAGSEGSLVLVVNKT